MCEAISGYFVVLAGNCLASTLDYIVMQMKQINRNKSILDDFLIVEAASPYARLDQACQVSLFSMLLAFRNLGIPVASNKTQGSDKV